MAIKYSNKNPPPVDLTPPPLETYASKFSRLTPAT